MYIYIANLMFIKSHRVWAETGLIFSLRVNWNTFGSHFWGKPAASFLKRVEKCSDHLKEIQMFVWKKGPQVCFQSNAAPRPESTCKPRLETCQTLHKASECSSAFWFQLQTCTWPPRAPSATLNLLTDSNQSLCGLSVCVKGRRLRRRTRVTSVCQQKYTAGYCEVNIGHITSGSGGGCVSSRRNGRGAETSPVRGLNWFKGKRWFMSLKHLCLRNSEGLGGQICINGLKSRII